MGLRPIMDTNYTRGTVEIQSPHCISGKLQAAIGARSLRLQVGHSSVAKPLVWCLAAVDLVFRETLSLVDS